LSSENALASLCARSMIATAQRVVEPKERSLGANQSDEKLRATGGFMQAQEQVVDGNAGAQRKNTASKFYRVTREASAERDERARSLHERFVHRTKLRAAWDAQECRDIRAAQELRLWEECGCINMSEYLMRTCGFTRREAAERIRVANMLTDLPRLEDELEAGRLAYSSVRELVRVVITDKQDEWIDHCAGLTSDQVARAVSGHKRGDSPDTPVDPNEHRHTVTFSLRDSTRARFNAAVSAMRRVRGHDFFDDDDLFQAISDILESQPELVALAPSEAELPSPDVVRAPMLVEEQSGNEAAGQLARTESGEGLRHTESARLLPDGPDAPVVDNTGKHAGCCKRDDGIPPEMLKAMRNALSRAPVCVWLMSDGRGFANGAELPPDELATLLCDSVNMGDIDDPKARARKRLSDRERARTLALHGNKCAVDGCNAEVNVDIHHIHPLEDGGEDIPSNRIPLCKGHHRLSHAGKLIITGLAPYSVTFRWVTPPVQELDAN
jgi:hypothetical protein